MTTEQKQRVLEMLDELRGAISAKRTRLYLTALAIASLLAVFYLGRSTGHVYQAVPLGNLGRYVIVHTPTGKAWHCAAAMCQEARFGELTNETN